MDFNTWWMKNWHSKPWTTGALEMAFREVSEQAWNASRSGDRKRAASHNSDYAKCADDILKLDRADGVINKRDCLVAILKRHFA